MKIIFRCDANEYIGQGHVMRCLSLADAFRNSGSECIFVCADEFGRDLAEKRGYITFFTGTDYKDLESDLPQTLEILKNEKADIVIADSYYVTNEYFSALKKTCKTAYFDDIYSFAYNVDILINYNIYADNAKYDALYQESNVKPIYVLGPSYTPLRKEFTSKKTKTIKEKADNYMLSVGGADPLRLALQFAEAFANDSFFENKKVNFVLGKMEPDIERIRELFENKDGMNVLVSVKDMKSLIEEADIVVSAAGSTQYEICACETPCICFSMADNQVEGGKEFEKKGAFIYAGDARENETFISDVINELKNLSEDFEKRKNMSFKASKVTDGRGAERLEMKLKEIIGKQ